MKETPIIFSTELIPKIFDGTKTMTRKVIKPQPPPYCDTVEQLRNGRWNFYKQADPDFHAYLKKGCPYGQVGDLMWVRETHIFEVNMDYPKDPRGHYEEEEYLIPHYKANNEDMSDWVDLETGDYGAKWHPSIHMPRWASRITLEITEIRAERVQEISIEDIRAEGINLDTDMFPSINTGDKYQLRFKSLWDSLNAERGYGWDTNCWVWPIRFKELTEVKDEHV